MKVPASRSPAIRVLSTRLFPKGQGPDAYRLTGLAARCDWVVLSDPGEHDPPAVLRKNAAGSPRTVFLSLRAPFAALACFHNEVLPRIRTDFVLVSGSEDVTLPNQRDRRWRRFDEREQAMINAILAHPRLRHWFIENRDEVLPRTSSLPLGYVFMRGESDLVEVPPLASPFAERPLRVFCAHRERAGAQWDTRRRVSALCRREWSGVVDLFEEELPSEQFRQALRRYPFALCVQGGGLDPSPKAWLALVEGTIPIIRSSALDDAYAGLPVAIVDDWRAAALGPERLADWRARLSPWFDQPALRAEVLRKLTLDYWWEQVEAAL